ncbi:MAG: hypothetical protein GF347_05620 [Candidatus Moranbacteria bacterium]|nr:hypothetical protein [Candidatus Moranbacteria bacterium]
MLEIEIQKLGLTEKEAKVYIALLHLGKAVIQEIGKSAGVNRVTTYNIIDSLAEKGLIKSAIVGKKTYFIAEHPKELINLIGLQRKKLEKRKKDLAEHLTHLKKIYKKSNNKPTVKFFSGVEGLQSYYDYVLNMKGNELINISYLDATQNFYPQHNKEYVPKKVKKKINSKLIYISQKGKNKNYESNKSKLRKSKYIPYEEMPFESDIAVFDDITTLASYGKEIIFVLIQDKEISKSMKTMLNFIFKN